MNILDKSIVDIQTFVVLSFLEGIRIGKKNTTATTKRVFYLTPAKAASYIVDKESDGFCIGCKSINEDAGLNLDTKEYPCPRCSGNDLYGFQAALMSGYICITDEDLYI